MTNSFDVLVVGAGPTGLFLACELALSDASVLVLEREISADSSWRSGPLGMRGINTPSTEALYRRGLLGDVFNGDESPKYFEPSTSFQFAGHFAGIMLDGNKVDFSSWNKYLPRPLRPGPTTLGKLEDALWKRAESLGVQIRRGVDVTRLVEEDDVVRVLIGKESIAAKYLVGCDGGRSFVRRAAGFEWTGTEGEFTGFLTNAKCEPPLENTFHNTGNGMTIVTFGGNHSAIEFSTEFDRSQPVTKEYFEGVLQRVTGTDMKVLSMDMAHSFTDRAKQVSQYRRGRVFLAGDSAHIHSPLGAQGLNLGISDALNLGWKLAAVIKGHSSQSVLDTYHTERQPAGAQVLDWTRAQTALLRPNAHSRALYKITQDALNTPGGANYYIDKHWGLSQRYDLGDPHPFVGRTVPDFEFVNGQRLGPQLQNGRFTVVDFEGTKSVTEWAQSLAPIVQYLGMDAWEKLGLKTLLIRPDGIVAWVAEDDEQVEALKAALAKWIDPSAIMAES